MKTFQDYLVESARTYDYRIKIVGDTPNNFIKELTSKFDQFDPVSVSSPKTTPIQKQPADFPGFPNESVTFFDVSFTYPAIEPQIKQLAQLLGVDPNRVIMPTQKYDESNEIIAKDVEDQNKDLLADTDFPAPDKAQKAASKDYATGPYDHAVLKNAYRSDFTVAGGKTPVPETTNDLPMGTKSPMSTIKRPARPLTGRNPRG
jgi:hypothetical protein